MGTKRQDATARTLASMRRAGIALQHSDTHTPDGRRKREPRPLPRRQSSGRAAVVATMRAGW